MKRFARFVPALFLAMALLPITEAVGQTNEYCDFDQGQQAPLTQTGGAYIPSSGTLRVLMVFIDFSDDSYQPSNPTWPVGQGPNYLSQIIDPDENQPSDLINNVTTYFRDMSFNNLQMVGVAVYRQARYSKATYVANPSWNSNIPYWATRHVIEDMDQKDGFDFSPYDNWTRVGLYDIRPDADGIIDMIFACYRYVTPFSNGFLAEGWAHLGDGADYSVNGDLQTVQTSYPAYNNNGSGVTVVQMIQYPRLEHVKHEFGHFLGLPHNYSGGLWSIMGHRHPNVSSFMNSFEREQMGWINFTNITIDGTTDVISDFGTTGDAYRITIPATSESFLIENHQLLSPYDVIDLSSGGGPGLYILQQSSWGELRVVAADGRWNWSNPYWIQNIFNPGNPLDSIAVFNRGAINRASGQTDKVDHITTKVDQYGSPIYSLTFAWLDEVDGSLKTGQRYMGDGKDRFTFANNKMFSPVERVRCIQLGRFDGNNDWSRNHRYERYKHQRKILYNQPPQWSSIETS